ncbi:hypothetical protein JTB14_033185 [Gonioctena quinquepunctata]|nr:hypothetical protein JTB14_033185 [Gonioctena quinquepunctata]
MDEEGEMLKTRLFHNVKRARVAVSPEGITKYFEELQSSLEDIPPEAIINYDETSMQDKTDKSEIIVRRNCKDPEKLNDSSITEFYVMFAGTASGITFPALIVYKSLTNMYHTWMEGGPTAARYSRSKSAWFERPLFEGWFISIALPYFKELGVGTECIIGDNLASHISVRVLDLCIDNNIKILLLPPNSTHSGQPLSLTYFSPLKTACRKMLQGFKNNRYRGSMTRVVFPRHLKKLWMQ